MSNPFSIDKATLTNLVAATIVVGYVAFMFLRPEVVVPKALETMGQIAFGWFFATGSIAVYQKLQKTQ
jgi:hypothetical protein